MLTMVVLVAGLTGLIVLMMLLRGWRRYDDRLRPPPPQHPRLPDPWRAAADRLDQTDPPEDTDGEPDPWRTAADRLDQTDPPEGANGEAGPEAPDSDDRDER